MCEPTTLLIASTALAVTSAVAQGQAKQDQANYEAGVARNNQKTAEFAAQDALRRGDIEAGRVQRNANSVLGSQRASFAAKGLDLHDGTPGDIMDQTNFFGKIDAESARYNGKVEAWQKQSQANNFGAQASAASSRAGSAMTESLLSAGTSVASNWYSYGGGAPKAKPKMDSYE